MDKVEEQKYIDLHGVRVNNLKDISLKIPRGKLVVISGLSGSGKSSLAFDTLYAEGQRRYVESLSVYARQFVSKMSKPEADYITGIPPAIAIRQRVPNRTPRSTVGTMTEVYDYLRMFFARVGHTFSPISGEEVKRHSTADVVAFVNSLAPDTAVMICAPMIVPHGRSLEEHLQLQLANGYVRVLREGEVVRISDLLEAKGLSRMKKSGMHLVIDRVRVQPDRDATTIRIGDSVETAFFEGRGDCLVVWEGGERAFSDRFEADGLLFEEPTDKLFSFNSSLGACPTCEGYGQVMGIDEDRVIRDKRLSLYEECVMCWRGAKMSKWKDRFIQDTADLGFPIHKPYHLLSDADRDLLWNGKPGQVYGINDFFDFLRKNTHKMHYRIMLARYRGKSICPTCKGRRLKKEAFYVKIAGKSIGDLVEMSIGELNEWLGHLELPADDRKIGEQLLDELRHRVGFLDAIGLNYLTLGRIAGTLSGGESQRITIAKSLSGGLIGALYILDEPSIGLHARDTHLLIEVLRALTNAGNTVVVVEHDEEVIRAADLIIDLGPNAGRLGGEIVYQGSPNDLPQKPTKSYTVEYLTGRMKIPEVTERRPFDRSIVIKGAYKHNLKGIDVTFPLNVLTVVTGVSGSGKSTLVREVFYEGLSAIKSGLATDSPVACDEISGNVSDVKQIEYVSQDALGKSTRSNPVTYIGAYDDIRNLMAEQPLSKQLGFSAGFFSFNREGGRCEYCQGEGVVTVEMQFMADMEIECEECHGRRFQDDVLEVRFRDKNIYDILEMTVSEAVAFFGKYADEEPYCGSIASAISVLERVGLGYVKLGQNSGTLSGGESQRVKLASYLIGKRREHTLFIFDEPTTGLHIHDIHVLMDAFRALLDEGHTVVIVEHNMEVIKSADYVIDLGPDGGKAGGHLVYQGRPEGLTEVSDSFTGQYLKKAMSR